MIQKRENNQVAFEYDDNVCISEREDTSLRKLQLKSLNHIIPVKWMMHYKHG